MLYGCGDFITDYEGIYGYEQYRGDLALAYLARYSGEGALTELTLVPYQTLSLPAATGVQEGYGVAPIHARS